jgi:hypothetical protein
MIYVIASHQELWNQLNATQQLLSKMKQQLLKARHPF